MKNSAAVPLVALAVGIIALGVALFRSPSAADGDAAERRIRPLGAASDSDLAASVAALAAENRELRERLAALELAPLVTHSPRAVALETYVTAEELAAFREELAAALESLAAPEALASRIREPEVKVHLADALQEIRRDERVAAVQAKQEARVDQLDARMEEVSDWLRLTPQQSDAMHSALLARYDREAELVRRWQAGEDPEVLGQVKAEDSRVHRAELEAILSPAQLERYTARGADE